jgi:hypothetical protein
VSDAVDVWCWNILAAVNTDVRIAHVIGHYQHDIRSLSLTVRRLENDADDDENDGGRG